MWVMAENGLSGCWLRRSEYGVAERDRGVGMGERDLSW